MPSMTVTIASPKNASKLGAQALKAKAEKEAKAKPEDKKGERHA